MWVFKPMTKATAIAGGSSAYGSSGVGIYYHIYRMMMSGYRTAMNSHGQWHHRRSASVLGGGGST